MSIGITKHISSSSCTFNFNDSENPKFTIGVDLTQNKFKITIDNGIGTSLCAIVFIVTNKYFTGKH